MEAISVISLFSISLTLIYIMVIGFFIRGWAKIPVFKSNKYSFTTKVSIIVAARNEEKDIENLILDILEQEYPKNYLEIIIVDDHSTDRTAEIVSNYAESGVQLISLNEKDEINSYKKKALETAIKQSTGQLIVTTDADCRFGKLWIPTIVEYYETHKYPMISSPVAFFEGKTFFEQCQALEFSYLIGLGAATIGNGHPSTCNGANLAYERKAFDAVGGFKGIDNVASGDDELLLHKIAALFDNKIGFLKSEHAVVYTRAKTTVAEFLQQRKRWASKTTTYKNKSILILASAIWLFNLSLVLTFFFGVFSNYQYLYIFGIQIALKLLVEFIFLYLICTFFKRKYWLNYLVPTSLLHITYIVYIGLVGNTGKYVWKGRKVN